MKTEICIDKTIFNDYPSFRRGIIVATNLHNHGGSPELYARLNQAIVQASQHPIDLSTDPRIVDWNEAHRQFQSNSNKFPPAHRNLLKRVQKPGTHIPFVNKAVAIMNINSIVDVIPVGGDDVSSVGQRLELRHATGTETFTPLGSPEMVEQPDQGEVIYVVADSSEIMCRRWNWRNSHKTRITEDTRIIVMNIDGLGEDSEARTLVTRDRAAKMLEKFCQAEVTTALLSPSHPFYRLEI